MTFVLISQNRADALTKDARGFAGLAQQDHDQNEELLRLSRRMLTLTEAVHKSTGTGIAPDSSCSS